MTDSIQAWRKQRFADALKLGFNGNKAAFGRALGYKDGAFVRQMLLGDRPITEKTVAAVEALDPVFRKWFDPPGEPLPKGVQSSVETAVDTAFREASDPVSAARAISNFLLMMEGLPRETAATIIHYLADHPDRISEVMRELRKLGPPSGQETT